MSVTFTPGQKIQQTGNLRIWEITRQAADRISAASGRAERRWEITLVTPSSHDDRFVGDITISSETWITTNCTDWPDLVAAPCGEGEQHVRICTLRRRVIVESTFSAAENAVAYIREHLALADAHHAEWFGWVPDGEHLPDLVAYTDGDGLKWQEVGNKVS